MMKRPGFTLFLPRLLPQLLALLALAVTTTVSADAGTQAGSQATTQAATPEIGPAPLVSYDRASDHLRVTAEAVSLKSVLGRIAQQSGIEVLFDDQADETVTINIQSVSLEEGIKDLLRGRNHMLRYSRDDSARLLLIGVMVLPAGQQDSGQARRLVAMDDEAYYRARSQLSTEQVQQLDLSSERWRARLGEMSPEIIEKLEKRTASRLLQQAQREQQRAEREKKHRQMTAEAKAKMQQRRESVLMALDPELRADFEQSGAEAREQVRLLIQENRR